MEHRISRQHVVDMCRTMLDRGYLKATEGNVSVRIPGHRSTPSRPATTTTTRCASRTSASSTSTASTSPDESGTSLAPSIECGMHANVYRERPDVNAIVHTHQPYASALAFLRKEIPALTDEQVRFLGKKVAIIPTRRRAPGSSPRTCRRRWRAATTPSSSPTTASSRWAPTRTARCSTWRCWRRSRIAYLLALATESGKVYTIPAAIREIAFSKLRKDEKRIAAQITESVAAGAGRRDRGAAQCRREGRRGGRGRRAHARPRRGARRRGGAARLRHQRVPRRRGHHAPAQGAGRPADPRAAARRAARRPELLRHQVPGQQGDHRPREAAHPRRRAAQPGVQLPVPAGDRPGRGRLPHRPGRQHLHRLPAGRRPDDPGQQLRARSTSRSRP